MPVPSTGVSNNSINDYATFTGMYSQDKNQVNDDPNAVAYGKALVGELNNDGKDAMAAKVESALNGQENVDFNGGAKADADTTLASWIADTKTSLDKSFPTAAQDFQDEINKNDFRGAQKTLQTVHNGNDNLDVKFSNEDFDKGMQALEVKSYQHDVGVGNDNEARNDLKNFKNENGTDSIFDEISSVSKDASNVSTDDSGIGVS